MGVFSENAIIGASNASGYDIDYSCRFNDGDNSYLARTPSSAGNQKTWTVSFWYKRTDMGNYESGDPYIIVGGSGTNPITIIGIDRNDYLWLRNVTSSGYDINLLTSQVFRDPSAWLHIVVAMDTTQATAANRTKIYVNGSQVTAFGTETYPAQNLVTGINDDTLQEIMKGDNYHSGYLADFNLIDGQALTPSDFGETDATTNEWNPIKYAGSYGTNGFYLEFKSSGALGTDTSGNGNTYTSTNLAATDQMLDTPTNNFPTFNPLTNYPNPQGAGTETLTEGNTRFKITTNAYGSKICNGIVNSGKWYMEILVNDLYLDDQFFAAIASFDNVDESQMFYHCTTGTGDGWGYYNINSGSDAQTWNMTTEAGVTSSLTPVVVGDIFAIAMDLDSSPRSVKFYINNTLAATIADIDTSGTMKNIIVGMGERGVDLDMIVNFGQDSSFAGLKTAQGNTDGNGYGDFYYAPPTGYMANCTKNLPDPSIKKPEEHFVTTLVSGNATNRSITGLSFQPDFLWGKSRTNTLNHYLTDSVRGINKQLYSDTYTSENSETVIYTAFNSDGFSLGTGDMNLSGQNYVHWAWKGGGTAVSNSDGSITSSVSANTTAGFSVVGWTGTGSNATVGHGLSQAPELIINKSRPGNTSTYQWAVQSMLWVDASDTNMMYLNSDSAQSDDTNVFQAAPTASVFSPQGGAWSGIGAAEDYIAYCFHSVEGYCKIGRYDGNGVANGTFIETGFRPAYVMVKRANNANDWRIFDNKRDPINQNYHRLQANLNYAEGTETWNYNDFLSNGFKWRVNDGGYNGSGNYYLYIAFAESPFKYARAR